MQVIRGTVEAYGQHYLNGAFGVSYTFVRFALPDGRTVTLNNVAADDMLNSYLVPGASGAFAFFPHQKAQVLCGVAIAGRVVAPASLGPARMVENKRKRSWFLIIGGLVLTPFVVGIPVLIFGVLQLSKMPKMAGPKPADVEAALRAAR